MSDSTFKFTELRMGTPWDNLTAAIGIIQTEILAGETVLKPDVLFGTDRFKHVGLETAVALLVAVVGEVEDVRWSNREA